MVSIWAFVFAKTKEQGLLLFLVPGKIWTLNFQIRSLTLYPIELQAQKKEAKRGNWTLTEALARPYSTIKLFSQISLFLQRQKGFLLKIRNIQRRELQGLLLKRAPVQEDPQSWQRKILWAVGKGGRDVTPLNDEFNGIYFLNEG